MSKTSLGEHLIQAGVLNEAELRVAESEKKRWGENLARTLIELNLVAEAELIPLVGEFINVPIVVLANTQVDEKLVRLLDEEFCRHNECIAYGTDEGGRFLHVAMADPNNLEIFDQIRVKTQRNIRTFLAGPSDIQSALTRILRGATELSPDLQFSLMNETLLELGEGEGEDEDEDVEATAGTSLSAQIDLGAELEEEEEEDDDDEEPTPAPPRPTGGAAPSPVVAAEIAQLRREVKELGDRVDQFLYALAWHLTSRGLLPQELVTGQMVPYPGAAQATAQTHPAEPSPPARQAAPPQQMPRPASPKPRARPPLKPAEPAPRPPRPPQPVKQVSRPRAAPPPQPAVAPPRRERISEEITAVTVEVDAEPPPPPPGGAIVDRPPPRDDGDPPPPRPSGRVITSSGANKAVASGEIKTPPPADPSASSAVLLETPEAIEEPIVAIDFGTTRSSVAMLVENRIEVIKLPKVAVLRLPGGEWDMPSAVGFRKDGTVMLGQSARKMLATDPSNAVMSPKRLLGRQHDDPAIQPVLANMAVPTIPGPTGEVMLRVRGRNISVTEVCAHILNLLKLVAQRNLERDVKDVVLSTPVSFGEPQYAALKRAAKAAGLNVLGFVDEPVAAAASNRYDEHFRGLVAVYDFGGGTFDFTVVEVEEVGLKVIAKGGDAWLGGDDIDSVLANAAANAFWRQTGVELRNQVTQWQRLLLASEYAKRELSLKTKAALRLPQAALTAKGPLDLNFTLSRSLFAKLCQEIITRTLQTCQETLERAGLSPGDVNAVYVSGGTSYIPAVQQALVQYFGKVPRSAVPPERAVLVGAALHRAFVEP